jgi:hypothetical protein
MEENTVRSFAITCSSPFRSKEEKKERERARETEVCIP